MTGMAAFWLFAAVCVWSYFKSWRDHNAQVHVERMEKMRLITRRPYQDGTDE